MVPDGIRDMGVEETGGLPSTEGNGGIPVGGIKLFDLRAASNQLALPTGVGAGAGCCGWNCDRGTGGAEGRGGVGAAAGLLYCFNS